MELGDTVGHLDLPVGMVEEPMMSAAERDTIVQAGRAVVDPVDNVVNVAPPGGY
jgi:hypothetical protein